MNFDQVMDKVLDYEGESKLNYDTGGWTKYGISQKYHSDVNVRDLTRDQALAIYRHDYWDKLNIGNDPPDMRLAIMDAAVNEGTHDAEKWLEEVGTDNLSEYLKLRREQYYRLARSNPAKYGRYVKGWTNRLDRVARDSVPPPNVAGRGGSDVQVRDSRPLPIFQSQIAMGAGTVGAVSVTQTITTDPGFQGLLLRLVHSPSFWMCSAILVLVGYIMYRWWRDHGRGQP